MLDFNKLKKNISFEFVASIVTIFVFLTGINSLPSIFTTDNTEGIFNEKFNRSISIGILIISQVAYYVPFYIIMQYLRKRFLLNKQTIWINRGEPRALFMALMLFFLGLGISFLFLEAFWGPIDKISLNKNIAPHIFGVASLYGNGITVWLGLELKWL